jgi:hypothetical protein
MREVLAISYARILHILATVRLKQGTGRYAQSKCRSVSGVYNPILIVRKTEIGPYCLSKG